MNAEQATVKVHVSSDPGAHGVGPDNSIAEQIRIDLATAWGEMGGAWGVTPAIARVQAYLMARQEPLTEREVREALGLSHRAASLALAEAESWGIVERVREPRRVGRRGPAGVAYLAVGDHWQWFGRVIAERKIREGDPIVVVLEAKEREAGVALAADPGNRELAALRDWLAAFLVFVRLFDRAVGLVPQLDPRELERSLLLLGRIPDSTILRLFDLLRDLPDQDIIDLVDALSRLSPTAARRATKLMSGVIRTVSRQARELVAPDGVLAGAILEGYAKYRAASGYVADASNWSGGGLWELRPTKAFAWSSFPLDMTRFRF